MQKPIYYTVKTKILYLLLALFGGAVQSFAITGDSIKLVLEELDAIIDSKNVFHAQKEKDMEALKRKLKTATDKNEMLDIYGQLFNDYLHYQADSSLFYIDEKIRLLSSMERPDLNAEILINRAEVLGVMGMYTEALEQLEQVNSRTLDLKALNYYYRVYCACYGWLADYTTSRAVKQKYRQQANVYRDSILSVISQDLDKDIVQAERYLMKGEVAKSISMLKELSEKYPDRRQKAYIHCILSDAYERMGNLDLQIYYLAKTAIIDLKS